MPPGYRTLEMPPFQTEVCCQYKTPHFEDLVQKSLKHLFSLYKPFITCSNGNILDILGEIQIPSPMQLSLPLGSTTKELRQRRRMKSKGAKIEAW